MVPKFRAWEPDTKFMNDQVRVTSNRFGDGEILVEATDGFGWIEVKPEYLMQSTGLKDKNGVEIFEGDIVSVRNHPFQKTEKSGAGIEIDGDYAISWNEGDLTWCAGNLLLARLKPYVTVAGNVWENPELLEQVNE